MRDKFWEAETAHDFITTLNSNIINKIFLVKISQVSIQKSIDIQTFLASP